MRAFAPNLRKRQKTQCGVGQPKGCYRYLNWRYRYRYLNWHCVTRYVMHEVIFCYLYAYIQLFMLVCSGQASRENCWRNKRQLHQLFRQYVRLRMRRRQLQQFLYVCVCVSACLRPTLLHLVVTKCCALSLFFYSLTLCPCWLAERAQLLRVCVCLYVCTAALSAKSWGLVCGFCCCCCCANSLVSA